MLTHAGLGTTTAWSPGECCQALCALACKGSDCRKPSLEDAPWQRCCSSTVLVLVAIWHTNAGLAEISCKLDAAAQVGALVSGHIRRIEPYGTLVAIDDTRISGLLHISRISRAHVENVFVSVEFHLQPCMRKHLMHAWQRCEA